jgi:hypothetical protein
LNFKKVKAFLKLTSNLPWPISREKGHFLVTCLGFQLRSLSVSQLVPTFFVPNKDASTSASIWRDRMRAFSRSLAIRARPVRRVGVNGWTLLDFDLDSFTCREHPAEAVVRF